MTPDKWVAVAAIISAFCAVMCVVQWATARQVYWLYLWGLLALPIAWVVS